MGKIIYDEEFKKTIVSLIDTGKTVLELSTEYPVSLASINRWKKQYSKDRNTGFSREKAASSIKMKALEKELKDTKLERDNLKKDGKLLFQERQVRYHFIKKHRNEFPVEKMCSCMQVSKNAYYNWLKTANSKKQKATLVYLKKRIKELFNHHKQLYGSLRIQKALEKEKLCYSRSYIAVLMKELGLKSVLSK